MEQGKISYTLKYKFFIDMLDSRFMAPITAGPQIQAPRGRAVRAWRGAGAALLVWVLFGSAAAQSTESPASAQGANTAANSVANAAAAGASLTRKAARIVSAGRPLSELLPQLESTLGTRLVLVGNAGDAIVQGEVSAPDGLSLVRDLASRIRLDWALGKNEVFLSPEGGARPTVFTAPSAAVATAVAERANREFEPQGSNIRAVARREEVVVTGIPNWVSQVAALRIPALVEAARADLERERRRGSASGIAQAQDQNDPLTLTVFRLNNAYVDDKRLSVGSTTLSIPGVARLFRQFTGMAGGSLDGADSASAGRSGLGLGRAERADRVDALVGGRTPRAEAEPAEGSRSTDRGAMSRLERAELRAELRAEQLQEEIELAALRVDRVANLPAAIADSRTNALIVRDRSSRMEAHRSLINVLDQAVDMVQLDAFVIDIKTNRLDEFGLGLSWSGSGSVNGQNFAPGGANPGGSANVILQGVRGAQLLAQIRALEKTGDSELMTVPSVVTLNNLEATFSARENFFVKVAGNQDASLSRVTAETLLRVTPLISYSSDSAKERRIRLLISVQDGSVDGSASAVVDALPRTLENQISTQAVVRGGDTLVIGGQVVRKRVNNVAGLPIFGRIPLIGDLLNSRSTEVSQYVRIYVVRPRILGEDSERVQALQAPQDPDDSRHPAFKDVPNLLRGSGMSPSTPAAR